MRIELLPEAKDKLVKQSDRLGMTQIAMTSRIIEWFCDQDEMIMTAVLGLYPIDIRAEISTMVMKKLAEKNGKAK